MYAVQVLGDAGSGVISVTAKLDQPRPKAGELLIRVHAAGITSDEIRWPEVYTIQSRIPGHEMSGVVDRVGSGCVRGFRVGDEVYGLLKAGRGQCQAEWLECSEDDIAFKPKTLPHELAAALPMPCLTAWEAMTDHASIKPGMKVLVTGASGAVGQVLIQLLVKTHRAEVCALASPTQKVLLLGLGASQIIDYNEAGWQERHTGFDVIFDLAGRDVLSKCWSAVGSKGCIVTIGDPAPPWAFSGQPAVEASAKPEVKYKYFIVEPNADRLATAAEMFDGGDLHAIKIKPYSITEGQQAWLHASERGRVHKVVLTM